MRRRLHPYVYFVVTALLGLTIAWTSARAQSPAATTEPQQPTAFAYAAPALIKELDTKYPFPPPVPPSPRPGGVLHLPSGVFTLFRPYLRVYYRVGPGVGYAARVGVDLVFS